MTRYSEVLKENYDRVAQVVSLYALRRPQGTALDARFFEDNGVEERVHQQLFETWFTKSLPPVIAKSV